MLYLRRGNTRSKIAQHCYYIASCRVKLLVLPPRVQQYFCCRSSSFYSLNQFRKNLVVFLQVLQMATANKISQKRRKSLNISTIISGDGRPIRLARVQDESKPNNLLPSPLDSQDSGDDSQGTGEDLDFIEIL